MAKLQKQKSSKRTRSRGNRKRTGGMSLVRALPVPSDTLSKMRAYDMLIRDPCSAEFAYPPYAGTETGYLVRITYSYQPTGFLVGGTTGAIINNANVGLAIQPAAFPVTVVGASTPSTTSPVYSTLTAANTFLSSGAVRAYRPVAACLKWVPTGALSTRSGMVALGYQTSPNVVVGNPSAPADVLNLASNSLHRAPNGSDEHEIRFLPTSFDEVFTGIPAGLFPAGGTNTLALCNVDATVTSATTFAVNGYLEYTGVYEWTPGLIYGLQTSPKMSPAFTSQQYQSTIADVGAFLLRGVRTAAAYASSGFVQGAMSAVYQTIGSQSSTRTYASSMPRILN